MSFIRNGPFKDDNYWKNVDNLRIFKPIKRFSCIKINQKLLYK